MHRVHHIGPSTVRKLRQRYLEAWGLPWPEPDQFLETLWLEARQDHQALTTRRPPPEVWDATLTAMRECHQMPSPVKDIHP
jgi:hypothetical protein